MSQNCVDIKNDIHTLVNVVIADPTWMDLLLWSCATQEFITFDVVEAKERSYYDWCLINEFLSLSMKIFGYLHKQVDVFLNNFVNVIWDLKSTKGPSSSYFDYFFLSKVFNHIAKVASIVHLKLGDSYRPSYFPTSTSHLHDWLVATAWFLISKNTDDLLQVVNFLTWTGFDI
jgi:hypothetical protein